MAEATLTNTCCPRYSQLARFLKNTEAAPGASKKATGADTSLSVFDCIEADDNENVSWEEFR